MKTQEQIEREIRNLLASESHATTLSNKLFQPGVGLFGQLACDDVERRELTKTPLFRESQRRVQELMERDAEVLRQVSFYVEEHYPDSNVSLTVGTPSGSERHTAVVPS